MSLDDARRAVSGTPAKTLLSAAFTIVIMLCGWTLKTTVDHSTGLSAIKQSIDDLKQAIDLRDGQFDISIGKLEADNQAHALAIAGEDRALKDIQQELAENNSPVPRIEHRSPSPPAIVPPPPIPQIGNAISHLLGIRARGTRGRINQHHGR